MLTVEVAVLFPAFLLLVFGGVQAAVWYHARSLCLAAADAGARAARPTTATPAAGRTAAEAFLGHASGGLSDVTVSTSGSTPAMVRVQVSGTVPRVLPIPGLTLRVSQSAAMPREVWTVDGQR